MAWLLLHIQDSTWTSGEAAGTPTGGGDRHAPPKRDLSIRLARQASHLGEISDVDTLPSHFKMRGAAGHHHHLPPESSAVGYDPVGSPSSPPPFAPPRRRSTFKPPMSPDLPVMGDGGEGRAMGEPVRLIEFEAGEFPPPSSTGGEFPPPSSTGEPSKKASTAGGTPSSSQVGLDSTWFFGSLR